MDWLIKTQKIISLFWFVSVVILLISVIFVYSYLPVQVDFFLFNYNTPVFLSKAAFYFIVLGISVFTNLLLYGILYYIKKDSLSSYFYKSLLDGLSFAINLFICFSLIYFCIYINRDIINIYKYAWVGYAGISFLVAYFVFLPTITIIYLSQRRGLS